jgi:hypothetical protein
MLRSRSLDPQKLQGSIKLKLAAWHSTLLRMYAVVERLGKISVDPPNSTDHFNTPAPACAQQPRTSRHAKFFGRGAVDRCEFFG